MLAYVASRATVLVAMWLADVVDPGSFASLVKKWDGTFYLNAAVSGYPRELPVVAGQAAKSTIAFFPLFPMGARVLAFLPGLGPLAAAVVINLLGGLAATILVWCLGRAIWDRRTADGAAVLFAFFPGSFVFSIAYSEGLMLALSAGCLLLLHRQRWLLAGLCGALATATRPNALALVPAAAVAAFLAIRSGRRWSALVAPVLVPLGFVGFQVFLRQHTGRWDSWSRTQSEGWGQEVSLMATPNVVRDFLKVGLVDVNITVFLAGAILGLAAFALLVRARAPLPLLAYTAAILVLSLTSEALGVKPRFLLTAFPLFYGLARVLRRDSLSIAVGAEASVLGALTLLSLVTIVVTP